MEEGLKAQILEAKYESKLKFLGGGGGWGRGGFKTKNPHVGLWIFSETAQSLDPLYKIMLIWKREVID